MENVTPAAFSSTWEASMSEWGTQIQGAVEGVSQALAVGLGLEQNTFTDAATYGSHLLAPTSTDLKKYGRVGESE
jgi:isopenicillin N synthase-like dioxygenase